MTAHPLRIGAKKPGLSPGTLVHVGERKMDKSTARVVTYTPAQVEEKIPEDINDCFPLPKAPAVTWINICGVHDEVMIGKIGEHFKLHPLVLEDIMHTTQRPKVDDFSHTLFCVLNAFFYSEEDEEVKGEQVSIILGHNYVLSFQEGKDDIFDPVLKRIRERKGKIRDMQSDYLAYALIDSLVDNYFVILERIGEHIEEIEDSLLGEPTPDMLKQIHLVRRELIYIRKSLWPLREVVGVLERGEASLITETTRIYLRDVYDHAVQVIDTTESYRETATGMLEVYLSGLNNRMNEVMKMLTIIATIFIPLTFICGIYGMNWHYMPELSWHWGYPAVLGVMLAIALGMIFYFRKKQWL